MLKERREGKDWRENANSGNRYSKRCKQHISDSCKIHSTIQMNIVQLMGRVGRRLLVGSLWRI